MKVDNENSKIISIILIIITIILIAIPVVLNLLSMNISSELSNMPSIERTGESAGSLVYVLLYFFTVTLGMWLLVINLVIIAIIWIVYFIKRKKSKKIIVNNDSK